MNILAALGTTQLLILAVVAIIPFIALIDILRNEFTGSNKIIWVLMVILLPGLGVILYLTIGVTQKLKRGNRQVQQRNTSEI